MRQEVGNEMESEAGAHILELSIFYHYRIGI